MALWNAIGIILIIVSATGIIGTIFDIRNTKKNGGFKHDLQEGDF